MATTSRPLELLVFGVRDSTGAIVSSGKVRWYNPGTLVAATAYTDAACTTPATAPLTLTAGGTGTLYLLEPVRVVIKDSTETTTYYDDIPALVRERDVYVTHPSFNSGAETTLYNLLTSFATSLGTNLNYKESTGATARAYSTWIGELAVSVKDFGALGDGATDDTTAIQAAYDRVKARGGGWVYWPIGTYKITTAISIDTASLNTMGAGRATVVKNFGTATNAFTVNLGSSVDSKMTFKDISITASTTSSGAGISFTNGNSPEMLNVSVALHRTGISTAAITGAALRDVVIASTDDNAAGVGVSLGTRCRMSDCEITCGTTNGTGIAASGNDARITDCYVTKFSTGVTLSGTACQIKGGHVFNAGTTGVSATGTESVVRDTTVDTTATGISLAGARSIAKGCNVYTTTTGISLGAANTGALDNMVKAATTGFSVGAFASCQVVNNIVSGNTTDLSVNASATLLVEHSNGFNTLSDSATTPHSWVKDRPKVKKITKITDATTTPAFTPTPATCDIFVCDSSSTGAVTSFTVNATATTGLVDGQEFTLVLQRAAGGTGSPTPVFNGNLAVSYTPNSANANTRQVHTYVWRASVSAWQTTAVISPTAQTLVGTNLW